MSLNPAKSWTKFERNDRAIRPLAPPFHPPSNPTGRRRRCAGSRELMRRRGFASKETSGLTAARRCAGGKDRGGHECRNPGKLEQEESAQATSTGRSIAITRACIGQLLCLNEYRHGQDMKKPST
jgi:hypothetical protein